MSFKFNWIENDVLVEFKEVLDVKQLHQINDMIYGDPRFDNMKFQIFDFTNVLKNNLLIEEVQILSTLDKSATFWNNSVKIACVATDDYMKEMILVYTHEMQSTSWSCEIFENIEDAKKWCAE